MTTSRLSILPSFQFRAWERVLLIVAIVIVLLSLFLLLMDARLHIGLLGLGESDRGDQMVVGSMGEANGVVRRQGLESTIFKPLKTQDDLINEDTIFTDSKGKALLDLTQGGEIRLGPNTMVRLEVENRGGVGGVSREAMVQVISGDVVVIAKDQPVRIRSAEGKIIEIPANQERVVHVDKKPMTLPKEEPEILKSDDLPVAPVQRVAETELPAAIPETKILKKEKVSGTEVLKTIPEPAKLSATALTALLPKNGSRFSIAAGETAVHVPFQSVAPEGANAQLKILHQQMPDGSSGKGVVLERSVTGKSEWIADLDWPGKYTAQYFDLAGQSISAPISFEVNRDAEFLETFPETIGGLSFDEANSGKTIISSFAVKLNWQAYPRTDSYKLVVAHPEQREKVLLVRYLAQPGFQFNLNELGQNRFAYRVEIERKSGFRFLSKWKTLGYEVGTPSPTEPVSGSRHPSGTPLLLAWKKVSFHESYEIEVKKEGLPATILKEKSLDNFLFLKNLQPGAYQWRVRSWLGNQFGPYSVPAQFQILP